MQLGGGGATVEEEEITQAALQVSSTHARAVQDSNKQIVLHINNKKNGSKQSDIKHKANQYAYCTIIFPTKPIISTAHLINVICLEHSMELK